ncbi:hypothetical protein HII31_12308 [Pseudocercospora fuligena]|uniref:Uncharacterized protein n=1 Tax=Pseudocercospora fuligena TaxID=685502 RepID=A0A8H6R9K7_9PEZI|nr:hypothetical protein HII31_12308 [Pseudocercospora fuligena]
MSSQVPSRREAKRLKKLTGKDSVDTPMPDAEQTQGEGLQKNAPFTFSSAKSQLQSTPMEGIESTATGPGLSSEVKTHRQRSGSSEYVQALRKRGDKHTDLREW